MIEKPVVQQKDGVLLHGRVVVVGEWSEDMLDVLEKGDRIRSLVRSADVRKARALIQKLPVEEQAALVLLDLEDREETLSLTGRGGLIAGGYNPQVVNLLPSEVLADLIGSDTLYLKYNTELIRALSPEKLGEIVRDTLEDVDQSSARREISWEWLEALAQLDDVDKRAELLRGVEVELLVDALGEVIHRFDFRSLHHFREITELPVGGWPGLHIDDPDLVPVLDALYEAAPDVLTEMIRRAWERFGRDEVEEVQDE